MRRPLAAALLMILTVGIAVPAVADEYIDRANRTYATIRADRRSDVVLLPLVAAMTPPPPGLMVGDRPRLLPATSSDFKPAADWAAAAPQQAVLAAMARITQGEAFADGFAFGQPYGDQAVAALPGGIDLIRAGLFTDLGDPPMLAAARFRYLEGLDRLVTLVHIEATRLTAAGEPAKAIEALTNLVFIGRQIAQRAFLAEASWGFRVMSAALERIRDVAYQDFRTGSPKLTNEVLTAINARVREDGYLRTDLIPFPAADREAAAQAIAATFEPRGGPIAATFATTMARLGSAQRPLRLFAESARWEAAASTHATQPETTARIAAIFGDWTSRWPLDPWDTRMSLASDYDRLPRGRFAALAATVTDAGPLFHKRQVVRAQLVGTRCALAVLGFHSRARNFPPLLSSTTPQFIRTVEADPFNPDRARGRVPAMGYFVPVRDAGRGAPGTGPLETNIVSPSVANFRVNIGQDQFVLYSVGPDGKAELARDVTGEPDRAAVGDMLIWPPVLSLVRQRLIETGQLK